MNTRLKGTMVSVAVAAAAFWLTLSRPRVRARPQGVARNKWDSKPNLEGIWQYIGTANWNIEGRPNQPGPYPATMGAWGARPAGQGIGSTVRCRTA